MIGHSSFMFNTGRMVPTIGFGTWDLVPDAVAKEAVLTALEAGYRVIDTAHMYGNERGIGQAIRESGIPREQITLITKVWNADQGFDRTLHACSRSLEALGLEYIDLYLIHWPATTRRHDSWRALEALHLNGIIKAAGVSNYTVQHLQELAHRSSLVPAVNQVEFHPYIYEEQLSLLAYCRRQGILVQAYSPLSRLEHRPSPTVTQIARQLGRTPQQIFLRWCIQHGTMPLPRSGNPEHIRSNIDIFDFELDDDDMHEIDSLTDGSRVTWDPAGMGYHHAI